MSNLIQNVNGVPKYKDPVTGVIYEGAQRAAVDSAALTDNSGGAVADGIIGAVTLPDLSGWNGTAAVTAAQATAINAAITANRDAITELATKLNDVLTKIKAAGLML